jgi:hypothetical protein
MEDVMAGWLKGLLTVIIATLLVAAMLLLVNVAGQIVPWSLLILAGGGFGLLYGLEAGILQIYDLNTGLGWVELLIDMTWSLPNTVFGFVFGNLIYVFFGLPSKASSQGQGWVVYTPYSSSTTFGNSVLQTLGTINIGGSGQHERMHLLQARIFGPLYLPLFALFYIATFLIQVLWTAMLGWILLLLNVRDTAWFTPPSSSAVSGFWGWIYYATPFELWAYASGNP